MVDIKVNLSCVLPGSALVSSQEVAKNNLKEKEEKLVINASFYDKKNKKKVNKQEVITYNIRPQTIAKQSLNICKDAYNYMISNTPPIGIKPKDWNRMNKKSRLEYHLQEICNALGGIEFSYEIFED